MVRVQFDSESFLLGSLPRFSPEGKNTHTFVFQTQERIQLVSFFSSVFTVVRYDFFARMSK